MIINSVAYRNGVSIGTVPIENISEVVTEPNTFVWLGVHDPSPELLRTIQEEFSLHELAIEDARKAHQRPKIETYGDSLFIALKTARLDAGEVVSGETHFFVGTHFLISIRHGEFSGYASVRARCEDSPEKLAKGPGFALYALLDFIVDSYGPIVEQFDQDLDSLEEAVFQEKFDRPVLARIYDLKRQLLALRNAALPVVDICTELMRFHEHTIPKDIRVYFRDVQDHALRVVNATDHMRDMLMTAMQANLALVTVAQNEVVKRFSGWGAMLVLPTVVFSLYGMNFKVMPELSWRFGYPAVLVGTALACLALYRKLKRSGWL